MVEEHLSALEVTQQVQAVIAALDNAKTGLIRGQIKPHFEEAVGELSPKTQQMLGQMSELAKSL